MFQSEKFNTLYNANFTANKKLLYIIFDGSTGLVTKWENLYKSVKLFSKAGVLFILLNNYTLNASVPNLKSK